MADEAAPPPQTGQFNPAAPITTSSSAPALVSTPVPADPPVVSPPANDPPVVNPADEALSQFESALADLLEKAESDVTAMVAAFETKLKAGQTEVDSITTELKKGGLVGRLHELELAVASHAAPAFMQAGHDGYGMLQTWFKNIEERFQKTAEANKAPAPAPQAPPPIA